MVCQDNGLSSALCADFNMKFNDPEHNEADMKRTMAMMDLAVDFETDVITTHIGHVPTMRTRLNFKTYLKASKSSANTATA